jgi:hypothetical protein
VWGGREQGRAAGAAVRRRGAGMARGC